MASGTPEIRPSRTTAVRGSFSRRWRRNKGGKSVTGRLYMTAGGNESPRFIAPILRMNQRLAMRKYPKLAYEFRIIDGERHAGNQTESYNRGLRFVFAPVAPEQGPFVDPAP